MENTSSSLGQAHEPLTAEQACQECRRRKSKCDRQLPTCGLCQRFRRLCIYEKSRRTPLTRRYLTELEEELARMKRLIRDFQRSENQSRLDCIRDETGHGSIDADRNVTPLVNHVGFAADQLESGSCVGSHSPGRNTDQSSKSNMHSYDPLAHQKTAAHDRGSFLNSAQPSGSTLDVMLETPPASDAFDWDERADRTSEDRFIDGMASIPSRSSSGGYLGVASGAALIRLTAQKAYENDSNDETSSVVNDGALSVPKAIWSLGQLEPFIDAYFRLYHISYPIVHEATFRAQYMEVIPRPKSKSWQALLYTIAALGVLTTATEPTTLDMGLFSAAKSRLSIDVLEVGSITLVQALTLISNYLQKRDKPNSGYNYTGLARRVAMGIGLHKDFTNWDARPLILEQRRRVWWGLFIFDMGAIITFSRPMDFPEGGIETNLPLNVHDADVTSATASLPENIQETTIYSHLRAQSTFHLATSKIYPKMISKPYPTAADMIELDDTVLQPWLLTLPPYFQENVIQSPRFSLCHSILRCRYRNFRLLMFRPFLVRRAMSREQDSTVLLGDAHNLDAMDVAVKRCLENAQESIELINWMWNNHPQTGLACWYCLYFLFQAVLVPVVCLRNLPQMPSAENWRAQINAAVALMDTMTKMNQSAERCVRVIRSLCGPYLITEPEYLGEPTTDSPQTQLAGVYPLMWPTLADSRLEDMDSLLQEYTIMDFMNQIPEFQ